MTDRPMTDGERARALALAQRIADAADAVSAIDGASRKAAIKRLNGATDNQYGVVQIARALISTSAAVRAMREALMQARCDLWDALHSYMSEAEFKKEVEYIDAVLSGIETEQAQARSPSALSAPTDLLQGKE